MPVNTSSMVSNAYSAYSAGSATGQAKKAEESKITKITTETSVAKKNGSYGKTIGDAKLSEEGAKYYEELKKKYGNLDFILVSRDQKANAQANAASYANGRKLVVLIDEDKIERMATDENYRKQYEGILSNATTGMSQLKASREKSGMTGNVKGFGMQVNDGGTSSFFAVLKKSSSDQKARIEKKAEQRKAEKKAADKKTAEKREEHRKAERAEQADRNRGPKDRFEEENDGDTVTITANSIEELMQKISDYTFNERSNNVQTDAEKMVGQSIDFRG